MVMDKIVEKERAFYASLLMMPKRIGRAKN